jgi:hypothetical protein
MNTLWMFCCTGQCNNMPVVRRSPEIENLILDRLAMGESLNKICQSDGMPRDSAVRFWADADSAFAAKYARARSIGLEVLADEILTISDECREGVKIEHKQIGWECPVCGLAARYQSTVFVHDLAGTLLCDGLDKPARVYEDKETRGDMVERSKLQIDARKWLLSKLKPGVYGDRQVLAGDPAAPLESRVTVEYIDKPAITDGA